MSVAVITVARGRHDHLQAQQRSLVRSSVPVRHVLVSMGDPVLRDWPRLEGLGLRRVWLPATGKRLPLAAARNVGAATALSWGADVLVFLDIDCLPAPGLVAAYAEAGRSDPGTVWSGPVTYLPPEVAGAALDDLAALDDPHPGRPAPKPGEVVHGADPDLFWSLSFALHASAWRTGGGFCEDYLGYGGEDTDFAASAGRRGLGFGWLGAARAYHQWHPVQDPPVDHLDDILRNATLFHARWGRWPMTGWLEGFQRLGLVRRTTDGWVRVGAA